MKEIFVKKSKNKNLENFLFIEQNEKFAQKIKGKFLLKTKGKIEQIFYNSRKISKTERKLCLEDPRKNEVKFCLKETFISPP